MRCPVCGHETDGSKKKCTTCGSNFKVVRATMAGKVKKKLRLPVGGLLLGLGMSLCAVALCFVLPMLFHPDAPVTTGPNTVGGNDGKSSHIPYLHHYSISAYGNVFYDRTKVLSTNAFATLSTNFDGSCALLYADSQLQKLSGTSSCFTVNEVFSYQLSTNSDGLVLVSRKNDQSTGGDEAIGTYHLTHYIGDEAQVLEELNIVSELVTAVISPDGKTVAYMLRRDGLYSLICSVADGSEARKTFHIPLDGNSQIFGSESLLAVSNNGEYIYTSYSSPLSSSMAQTLHCYDRRGNMSVLGAIHGFTDLSFNADHTQLLFYDGAETYLSVNGRPARLISEYQLSPLLPSNAKTIRPFDQIDLQETNYIPNPITNQIVYYPFDSFYNRLYIGTDGVRSQCTWYLTKDSCQKNTLGPISAYKLDPTGSYLYFISSQNLYYMPIHQNFSSAVLIDDGMDYGQLEIDLSSGKLYYIKNGDLYSYDRSGKDGPTQVCSIFKNPDNYIGLGPASGIWAGRDLFKLDEEGYIYYISDETLHVQAPNANTQTAVLSEEVFYIYNSPNGIVRIECLWEQGYTVYILNRRPDGIFELIT